MQTRFPACTTAALIAGLTVPSAHAILVDGNRDVDYGAAVSVQTTQTQFGDNLSELNAAYARVEGGNLFLLITGNIEANFNKLNIFIDSAAGGQNTIGAATDQGGLNPTNDNWAAKYSGIGASANGPGFTFDTGFTADYLVIVRRNGTQFDLDFNSVGNASVVEISGDVFAGTSEGSAAGVGASALGVAYDNANVAGILGGTAMADAAAAQAVMTGLELAIPLAALGSPAGDIRIAAHVNGSNHDYLSNQFLGGLGLPQGNLGGDGAGTFNGDLSLINLDGFAGNQYFTVVVPEPASLALLGLGGLALAGRRRR